MQLWTRRVVAADPSAAWQLLTDLDRWSDWGPSVRGASLEDPGRFETGATGIVHTALGVDLPFELTDVVDGTRWSWEIRGLAATSHEVVPHAGGARVSFGVPVWAPPYLVVCAMALRRIDTLLTRA